MAALLRARFLGSTTVGERGQIVIPADARKEFGLEFGDKVLVFGRQNKLGLLLVKDDVIARYVDETMAELTDLERLVDKKAAAGPEGMSSVATGGKSSKPRAPRARAPRARTKPQE